MTTPNPVLRQQVIGIYKELLNLGKEYPLGFSFFRSRLHKAFATQSDLRDPDEIRKAVERAESVRKEIQALYYLKRYRALRQRYDKI